MEYTEIVTLLAQYKYQLLFPLLILQGPLVAVVAGFLASGGVFKIGALSVAVTIADLISDTIIYSLGRWGRGKLINKYGRYVGLTDQRLEKAESFVNKHGHWALVVGKVAYSLGAPTMFFAGVSKMKYAKYIFINFLVAVPKSILLVLLGYYLGESMELVLKYLNYVGIGILLVVIVGGVSWLIKRRRKYRP
jgi:membrane-associated protein